jgi:hypothetical protein
MSEITAETMLAAFPQGLILPWYSKNSRVPAGWAICDGQNGTPDLRDRFLMGTGSFNDVGRRGGKAVHEARRVKQEDEEGKGHYCVKAADRSRQTEVLPPFETVVFIIKL